MSNATNSPLATTLEDAVEALVTPHRKIPSVGNSPTTATQTAIESIVVPALNAVTMDEDTIMEGIDHAELEPFAEPCTDDIQLEELAFWLGDSPADPEPTDCPCVTCIYDVSRSGSKKKTRGKIRGHFVYIPTPQSRELSPKIPVVALPRIQGVN